MSNGRYTCCERCGRQRQINTVRARNLCRDCIDADPEYIRLREKAAS